MSKMRFKDYYISNKENMIFEKTFKKFYNRGHWGNIEKDVIYKHQKEWYDQLKKIISEKDYGSLLTVLGHREHQVTRELFTKLTRINIKKKNVKYIKERLKKYCIEGK